MADLAVFFAALVYLEDGGHPYLALMAAMSAVVQVTATVLRRQVERWNREVV